VVVIIDCAAFQNCSDMIMNGVTSWWLVAGMVTGKNVIKRNEHKKVVASGGRCVCCAVMLSVYRARGDLFADKRKPKQEQ